ncbi:UNVERIFIED_CONTAM: hypothetical protein FKN15_052945 [Acipenser sinensis]
MSSALYGCGKVVSTCSLVSAVQLLQQHRQCCVVHPSSDNHVWQSGNYVQEHMAIDVCPGPIRPIRQISDYFPRFSPTGAEGPVSPAGQGQGQVPGQGATGQPSLQSITDTSTEWDSCDSDDSRAEGPVSPAGQGQGQVPGQGATGQPSLQSITDTSTEWDSCDSDDSTALGMLEFTLLYEKHTSSLHCTVIRAKEEAAEGSSGRRKQQQVQQQQHRASCRSRCFSATPDVCLACLDEEGWCFLCGEVRYLPCVQNPPWQGEQEDCPGWEPQDEEAEHPQPKALLAGEEYLLVSPPPPLSEGKEQELPPHPPRRTGPLSSEEIYRRRGGGQETSSPSYTFTAGETVVRAPWRGAAGHEEGGGGLETTPKISLVGGADLYSVHRDTTAVWVGGGPPTVAATFGPLLPLFLGRDCEPGLWGLRGEVAEKAMCDAHKGGQVSCPFVYYLFIF